MDRSVIKLMSKVVETFKHHVCTRFGISKEIHGRKCKKLAGIGQEKHGVRRKLQRPVKPYVQKTGRAEKRS